MRYQSVINGYGRKVYILTGNGPDGRPDMVTIQRMPHGWWYSSHNVGIGRLTRRQAMSAARAALNCTKVR